MSRKKVKERIEMYAQISNMKEIRMHKFKVLYYPEQKLTLIYLKYTELYKNMEGDIVEQHEELECYDGKGWLKVSKDFTQEDFDNMFKELKPSKYNIKDVKIVS